MKQQSTHSRSPHAVRPDARRSGVSRRRAVATLIVLLLISITFALSYSVMRSQGTAIQIEHNANLGTAARQAAVTGLTAALKKMHTADWAGVDSPLTGSLGGYQGYNVTFTAGDPALTAGHPDYADFPYRVTLLSTGFAADPADPQRISTHRVRAVVRLVPRVLADEPSDWATMQQYTVYQSKTDPFEIDIPCRLEGPVRVQGRLKVGRHYPNDFGAWRRYLRDLNYMRLDGLPDYRPFTGPVSLPFSGQDGDDLWALDGYLGATPLDTPVDEAARDWTKPTSLADYQIYDGGPVYKIPAVNSTLQNTTLEPDPLTNPLGLYYCDSSITISDNVTIRGSLFCKNDIAVDGVNVHFEPVELPPLHGSDAPVRLPVATCQNFTVRPTAGGSLTGLLAVFDQFLIEKSPETVKFVVTGRLIARKFFIKERQPWETLNWEAYFAEYKHQLAWWPGVVPYFPVWMIDYGRHPEPLLTVSPDPAPVNYHWKNPYDPIYVPHPDDVTGLDPGSPGLRWDVIQWTDNP